MAHIRHGDLWLLALGRFLLAVLFTHPLFWLLRRAIRGDQELLADAVAAGDNPHDYAEELVRLVRMTGADSPRSVSAAVGIWEGRSSFSRRIAMLLDETFRVSPTGSHRWRLKALAAMTVVGLICSLVTLQPARSTGEASADDEKVEKSEEPAPPSKKMAEKGPSAESKAEQTVHVAGTCVDSSKRPIAGAEVFLYETTLGGASLSLVEQKRSDAAGKFAFADLHLNLATSDEQTRFKKTGYVVMDDTTRHFVVIARAKDKARAYWQFSTVTFDPTVAARLKLELGDATTIKGRVTDTDGNPISGAEYIRRVFHLSFR